MLITHANSARKHTRENASSFGVLPNRQSTNPRPVLCALEKLLIRPQTAMMFSHQRRQTPYGEEAGINAEDLLGRSGSADLNRPQISRAGDTQTIAESNLHCAFHQRPPWDEVGLWRKWDFGVEIIHDFVGKDKKDPLRAILWPTAIVISVSRRGKGPMEPAHVAYLFILCVVSVAFAYELRFTEATLHFGRSISKIQEGRGFQDAVTPPYSTNLAIVTYVAVALVLGFGFYLYGIWLGLAVVALFYLIVLIARLLLIPKPKVRTFGI